MEKAKRSLEERVQALEDALEIANLKATYMDGADGGWSFNPTPSDADIIVPLFADEGLWHSDSQGSASGHKAIRKAWENFSRAMPFAFHMISNPKIEVDGDHATAKWHLLVRSTDANGQEMWAAGIYEDEYMRTPAGWRIQKTHPRLVFLGPYAKGWKALMDSANRADGNMPPEWRQMHEPPK